jgi:hypothetical protein
VYGTNFAYREWFKGLVASGRPFVSNAIVTKEATHTLAVTVTDYIRGADGRPLGILVSTTASHRSSHSPPTWAGLRGSP